MPNVLGYAEIRDGAAGKAAREVLGAAHELAVALGGEAHAVVVGGPGVKDAAADLGGFAAARIFVGEDEALQLHQPDVAAAAIARLVEGGDYAAVLFPATAQGKDLGPRVAARLGRGLATEVVSLDVDGGTIVARRPMYAGKATATLRFSEGPALMSIRANGFAPVERDAGGEVVDLEVRTSDARVHVTKMEQSDRDQVDVGEADIVVSGGRGMQGEEHWHLLEALVEALGDGAALGASRAVVDSGWRPHSEQVGQTGKTVSPNLYIAVGISGAIQHLAGMRTAKVIVAINRDADAPIFGVADYGLVGDAFEVLPSLTEAIRAVRGEG